MGLGEADTEYLKTPEAESDIKGFMREFEAQRRLLDPAIQESLKQSETRRHEFQQDVSSATLAKDAADAEALRLFNYGRPECFSLSH